MRFELTIEFTPYNGLANRLAYGHFSGIGRISARFSTRVRREQSRITHAAMAHLVAHLIAEGLRSPVPEPHRDSRGVPRSRRSDRSSPRRLAGRTDSARASSAPPGSDI